MSLDNKHVVFGLVKKGLGIITDVEVGRIDNRIEIYMALTINDVFLFTHNRISLVSSFLPIFLNWLIFLCIMV